MKRLVYQPQVQALVMRDAALKGKKAADIGKMEEYLIDISDDIVSGTVNRRINAMSDIQLVLQNKDGRYTQRAVIQPMDRIIVRMRRVGSPFLVFSGFVDDAPMYQLYPGTVTLAASDTLKLLHNTYFDPGLISFQTWFLAHGWAYDPSTGTLGAAGEVKPGGGLGNDDLSGSMHDIIFAMLHEIANWPADAIAIYDLPASFIDRCAYLLQNVTEDAKLTHAETVKLLNSLYGGLAARGSSPTGASGGGANPPPVGGGQRQSGNITMADVIGFARGAGWTGEDLVIAGAVAGLESSLKTDAFNDNGSSQDYGLWQINSSHASHPLLNGDMTKCYDPEICAAVAYSIYSGRLNSQGYLCRWADWTTYRITHSNPGSGCGVSFTDWNSASSDKKSEWQTYTAMAQDVLDQNPDQGTTGQAPSGTRTAMMKGDPQHGGVIVWKDTLKPADGNALAAWAEKNPDRDFPRDGETWEVPVGQSDTPRDQLAQTIADKVIQIAQGEIGRAPESYGTNDGPRIREYKAASTIGGANDQPWCVAFVQWVYKEAGRPLDFTSYTADSGTMLNVATNLHYTVPDPKPADIVIYNDDHTAIVVRVEGNQFWSIDGNSGNNVSARGPKTIGQPDPGHDGDVPTFMHVPGVGEATIQYHGVDNPPPAPGSTPGVDITQLTLAQLEQLAVQGTFFTQQFAQSDSTASRNLTGARALSNDVPVIEWIDTAVQASGRVYCTEPSGRFLAFFPDKFGILSDRTPYWYINDIEIVDLTINKNDTNLVTHVFTSGPVLPEAGIQLFDRMRASVASVEDEAFQFFIQGKEKPGGPVKFGKDFKPLDFLAHYGARPYINDLTNINNPFLLWMHGWMKFMELWSKRYTATASFTFMPEIFPGGLVSLGDRVQMYVESVTHTFDLAGGFNTSAELSSLKALNLSGFDLANPVFATETE